MDSTTRGSVTPWWLDPKKVTTGDNMAYRNYKKKNYKRGRGRGRGRGGKKIVKTVIYYR